MRESPPKSWVCTHTAPPLASLLVNSDHMRSNRPPPAIIIDTIVIDIPADIGRWSNPMILGDAPTMIKPLSPHVAVVVVAPPVDYSPIVSPLPHHHRKVFFYCTKSPYYKFNCFINKYISLLFLFLTILNINV